MPIDKVTIGQAAVVRIRVTRAMSADKFGNRGLLALATPALVGLFDRAAMSALSTAIANPERTVGGLIEVSTGRRLR